MPTPPSTNNDGDTAFILAEKAGAADLMKTLAKKDTAAEERISRELFEAADSGSLDRMTALIARGGNVNARDKNGATVPCPPPRRESTSCSF